MKRVITLEKKEAIRLAQQSGIMWEIASRKGNMAVYGRSAMPAKQKAKRKVRNRIVKQSRKMNRGA